MRVFLFAAPRSVCCCGSDGRRDPGTVRYSKKVIRRIRKAEERQKKGKAAGYSNRKEKHKKGKTAEYSDRNVRNSA